MKRIKFSRGYRKYIREQKAKTRRETLDFHRRRELINNLYQYLRTFKNQLK